LAKSKLGPYHIRLSTSPPLPLPTPSHCLSLDTISYIMVYTLHLSPLSSSPAVWNTWMMLMLTASFLPTSGHAAASVGTYSSSIYLLLIFYYVLHAPLPPQHGFFNPSTW
jgi:hypothetical protein